jgi:hypothetical protein
MPLVPKADGGWISGTLAFAGVGKHWYEIGIH